MKGALRLLRSPRTAILLLLGTTGWAVGATVPGIPTVWWGVGGVIAALLGASIASCTWERLRGRPVRSLRHAADLALHLALLILLAALLLKSATAVTTVSYLYPGEVIESFDDPASERPVKLGFAVRLRELRENFYPVRLVVGLEGAGESRVTELVLTEGRPPVEAAGIRLQTGMDGERLILLADGVPREVTRDLVIRQGGVRIVPLAFRRDVRNAAAEVDILEGGRIVRQGTVAMNERFVNRGTRLTLTGWGRDEGGTTYVSMQAVRDPFEPIFWLGAIIFSAAATTIIFAKRRAER